VIVLDIAGLGEFTSKHPTFLGQPGYVYVFQEGMQGPFKIGFTKEANAKRRLINVQVGNPRTIYKRAVVAVDTSTVEWVIHKMLRLYSHGGEWFFPTSTVLSFVGQIKSICQRIDKKLENINAS